MSSSTPSVTTGDMPHGPIITQGSDKPSADGDEELPGMQLATAMSPDIPGDAVAMDLEPEILDPAILAMSVEGRTHRPYHYTKERLLELRDAPLSRRRPDYLDVQHNNSVGLWDPERWHHDWKRSSPDPGAPDTAPHGKRRSGDPRERLRKEQDGIVLSPQRRSFNSGCFVPVNQPRRPESPLGGKGPEHLGHREISAGARRIGSGRIIARDVSWDYRPDKGDLDGPEFSFGRSGPGNNRERKDTDRDREDRYERRSFGRDFDRDRERDKDRHITRNGRYNDRRRISSDSKDDEPEWFSGGPTSQADTIELRGFEDALCEVERAPNGRKKPSPAQKKRNKERAITKSNESGSKDESPKGPGARSTPTPQDTHPPGPITHSPIQEEGSRSQTHTMTSQTQSITSLASQVQIAAVTSSSTAAGGDKNDKSEAPMDVSVTSVAEQSSGSQTVREMDFNLEDFLKMDSIPELLTNGVGNEVGKTAGSRFSRWFNKETSPVQNQEESRRSSLQDEHLVNNIINGLGDSDTYFAPISPAAATGGSGAQHNSAGVSQGPTSGAKPVTLLEILQRGKQAQQALKQSREVEGPATMKNMSGDVPGKVLSLEELEARMRQGGERAPEIQNSGPPGGNISRPKQDEDMSAFKRLLAQVSGGQAVAASNGPLPHKQSSLPSSHSSNIPNSHPANTNIPSSIPLSQQQPMSLLQMLSKSQQEDARAAQAQHSMLSPGGSIGGPHVPNDLVLKLHQVQQHQRQQQQAEMLSKLMNSGSRGQQFGLGHGDMNQGLGVGGRELLQRPEALAILQGLKRGDITPQHLIQQLAANPAMQPRHRELLMTILKQNQSVGPSPRVLSPIPPPQHMLFQQQQQQQLRVSPLPPTGMQQRIPSPRELQAHTQGIMQRALIKKKLEEQQENFRKKQEMQQRSQSPAVNNSSGSNTGVLAPSGVIAPSGVQGQASGPNQAGGNAQGGPTGGVPGNGARASPAKHMGSPTPLAFTPTSVLRKMTADKEDSLPSKDLKPSNENHPKHQQGRAVTGMRQQPTPQIQPLQPQNWNLQQPVKPPVGRPIVKGNNNYQFMTQSQEYQQLQLQQQMQNQRYQQQQQRAKLANQNQPQFGMQRGMQMRNPLQNLQQMQRGGNAWHQLVGQNFDTRGMPVTGRGLQLGRGSPGDGDLSPTSDQLARWFSPELLAQARAGKLPDMPPASIAQNALSLEELERIQQNTAPVHN